MAKALKLHQVLGELKKIKPHRPENAAFIARYVGGVGHEDRKPDEQSKLKFLGLKVPQIDLVYAMVDHDEVDLESLRAAALRAKHHEELAVFLYLLEVLDSKKLLAVKDLEPFIACIDNWAASDQLSSIMARAFERDQKSALARYRKWNKSKNPWMRRQSIVGLYYYAQQRKKHPPEKLVLELLENLLDDPHIYVQKGVGWTLRELYNVNPGLQRKFVDQHLKRISSTAWFATAEKYPVELRKRLVLLRRK